MTLLAFPRWGPSQCVLVHLVKLLVLLIYLGSQRWCFFTALCYDVYLTLALPFLFHDLTFWIWNQNEKWLGDYFSNYFLLWNWFRASDEHQDFLDMGVKRAAPRARPRPPRPPHGHVN
jgi:hypothetical protein